MAKKELDKSYEPKRYELDIYNSWEKSGFFNPDNCIKAGIAEPDATPFSIVLPPPNVTGTLHIGHAAMLAIEDVMIRYHRMKGDRTLWVPGTDHAAIATQEKVEKIMWNEEKLTRHDLGREKFLKRVEKYAQDSHDTIVNQSKRMGTSMDWSREYYSLDEKRNLAVRVAFKKMYDEGLIYRGDRIVNWDPKMQSNVSDIEVVRKEEKAPFYYLQYGPFVIGTARPETKFGDKYVVMHPRDERYVQYKSGDTFECEWINGKINATVIKDESVDMEFGSGVMTITPWHDATDFFIAERHGLDKEQIIDLNGNLLSIAGEFAGMSIADARQKIVEKLQAKGLIVKIDENYIHNIATNSRGGAVIEPQIMKQWWVDVDKEFKMRHSKIDGIKNGDTVTLQKLMQHVVRDNQIKILPERFEKQYFNWVDNLLDWCISRQLWYGHRIPVWYKGDEMYVGIEAPEGEGWQQDPDTLDTWFSAGLFSFSPLGWPDENAEDLKTYHPTSVLETGYDILTFWVVRMVLMSTYLLGEIPFKTVYLHGLVRDEHGNKMSKSLGNIIDPLDMCEKFGTDATRLSLLIGTGPGADSRLSEEKIAGFRNFANKLWNISRFMLLNIEKPEMNLEAPTPKTLADKWVLHELSDVVQAVTKNIENYQFSPAGEQLRDFTWSKLADWYLEIAKIEGAHGKQQILNYILNTILKLWHPYMPFVTEAIWQEVYGAGLLMVEKWPLYSYQMDKQELGQFELLQNMITAVRSLRAQFNVEPSQKIDAYVVVETSRQVEFIQLLSLDESEDGNGNMFMALGRMNSLVISSELPVEKTINTIVAGAAIHIVLEGTIDIEKECVRLQKEIDHVAPYVSAQEKKLANKNFVDNAPEPVIEEEKKKLGDAKEKLAKYTEQLKSLA